MLLPGAAAAEPKAETGLHLYFQGDAVSYKLALENKYLQLVNGSAPERLSLLTNLLDLCVHVEEEECLNKYLPEYTKLFPAFANSPSSMRYLIAARARLYNGYLILWSADHATLRRAIGSVIDRPDEISFGDMATYLRQKVLAAEAYRHLDEKQKSRSAVDKILSLVAAIQNVERQPFYVAFSVARSIEVLTDIKETERAYGVYVSSKKWLDASLPPRSLDRLRYGLAKIDLMTAMGDLPEARRSIDEARSALNLIKVPRDREQDTEAILANWTALVCVAQSDLGCAEAAMAQHPYAKRFSKPRAPDDSLELIYLTSRAFIGWSQGRDDDLAARSLAEPVSFDMSADNVAELEVYRLAGEAFATSNHTARPKRMAVVARKLATLFTARESGTFGSWYRPHLVDRLLIGGILSLPPQQLPDVDPDTRLSLMQLAARTKRSFDADAMVALSSVSDDATRSAAHEALRLRARRDRKEREALASLAAGSALSANPGAALRHSVGERAILRDHAKQLDQAWSALGRTPAFRSAALVASVSELQSALGPEEAGLLVAPALAGQVAAACVTREQVHFALTQVPVGQLADDVRLLLAGLSAEHPPNEALDKQYRAESAVRLYKAIVQPSETCLARARHLVWLSSLSDIQVPVAALMSEVPARDGQGYDLQRASWLINRFSISYAGSAAALTAARTRGSRTSDAPFDFLGIGDPLLSGRTADGRPRVASLLRGVRAAGGLDKLADLPETREELRQSAAGFSTANLLFSEAASESAVRKQLLGTYRYISFATHGLLREDLSGLSEPALVLTPVAAGGTTDNGLLTASELADLTLRARLVALSACNTANFDVAQFAADLPALSTAFAVAGVPMTLATLWKVDSRTSQDITSGVFQRLRVDPRGHAAAALADAQREFLAKPPSRAHLHPRFWAPFVPMGAEAPPAAAEPNRIVLKSVDRPGGAEIIRLARTKRGLVTRFMPDPQNGSHGAGLQLQDSMFRSLWVRDDRSVGAVEHLLELGSTVVTAGYSYSEANGMTALLDHVDFKTGKTLRRWEVPKTAALDSIIVGAASSGGASYILVLEAAVTRYQPSAAHMLAVYRLSPSAAPQRLFELATPFPVSHSNVHLNAVGNAFLISYSSAGHPRETEWFDDYDLLSCLEQKTRLELRSGKGDVIRAVELEHFVAEEAYKLEDGRVLLGGKAQQKCGEAHKARLYAVDQRLRVRELYRDGGFGASSVRTMTQLPSGELALAVHDSLRIAFKPARDLSQPRTDDEIDARGERIVSRLVLLTSSGAAAGELRLAAGFDVFLRTLAATQDGELLGGGAIGDSAVLFRFAVTGGLQNRGQSREQD